MLEGRVLANCVNSKGCIFGCKVVLQPKVAGVLWLKAGI
jgi:hypothetical protein